LNAARESARIIRATYMSTALDRAIGEIFHKDAPLVRTVDADLETQKTAEYIVMHAGDFHAMAVLHPGFTAVMRVMPGHDVVIVGQPDPNPGRLD
jgi:hypothetical protein